jgi:hypothetical protein
MLRTSGSKLASGWVGKSGSNDAIPRVILEAIARIAVAAEMVHVIVILEQAVLLDDPGHLGAHVRTDDGGGEFGVIVGRQLVADIVDQCRQQQLIVGAVVESAGGYLQAMPEPADRISCQGMIQPAQRLEYAIGQSCGIVALRSVQQQVILTATVLHPAKTDHLAHRSLSFDA